MKYLNHNNCLFLIITLFFLSCSPDSKDVDRNQTAYNQGVVGAFSELVNAGVKRLALSSPLPPSEMDDFIKEAERIALNHNVSIYRESDLIVTDLFPEGIAEGKDVLLLYKGTTLDEYFLLKEDIEKLEQSGAYSDKARMEIARRFGRLLSYSPQKINNLLSQNTSFRTMHDFGIRANNLFLYYKDLKNAGEFYSQTLGMEIVADYEMALILRMSHDSYLILVDATKGMHTAEEPKSVALALLTDQLQEWYDYLKRENVEIKYEYKSREGGPHDGFVAVDPEGYLLEFEMFKQHPENEKFIPLLNINKSKPVSGNSEGLSFHSTITWLYYEDVLAMQEFYENVLGLQMVADQGWTKIYQVSNSGFMAIVDGRRGMNKATENKAVNVGFIIDDLEGWHEHVKSAKLFELRGDELGVGPETRYKAFVGFDPENYYLEFDKFFPHDDNNLFLEYLNAED